MSYDHTILHVDDDPQVTREIAAILRENGLNVHSLNDPRQAMHELIRHQFRLVLLDIGMPFYSGMELLREIKANDGGVQVIMLSEPVTLNTALQSLRWGAEACFFKPLEDPSILLEAIEDVWWKLDRWWRTMEQLSHRHLQSAVSAAVTPTESIVTPQRDSSTSTDSIDTGVMPSPSIGTLYSESETVYPPVAPLRLPSELTSFESFATSAPLTPDPDDKQT